MNCNGLTKQGQPCRSTITQNGFCRVHTQQGEGIIDDARNFVKRTVKRAVNAVKRPLRNAIDRRINAIKEGPSNRPPAALQEFLNDHQGNKITKIELMRKPILKPIYTVLDGVSRGGFSQRQKELNYDDVYHNALMVTLDDGHVYTLEKNHRVEVKKTPAVDYANQRWDIPLHGRDLTMKQLVDNAARGVNNDDAFWKYRAGYNNCQQFTKEVIEENGLMPGVGDNAKHFEQQDAASLLTTLPGGDYIPNKITDLANVLDRVQHGDGVARNQMGLPCPF